MCLLPLELLFLRFAVVGRGDVLLLGGNMLLLLS